MFSCPPSAQGVPGLTRVSQRTLLSAAMFSLGSRGGSDAGSERCRGSWTSCQLPGELGGSFSGTNRQGVLIQKVFCPSEW